MVRNCKDCGINIRYKSQRCYYCSRKAMKKYRPLFKLGEVTGKCQCGCGEKLVFKKHNIYKGISKYISGHHPSWCKNLTKYTSEIVRRVSDKKKGNTWNIGKYRVQSPPMRICPVCSNNLTRKQLLGKKKYCSRNCYHKAQIKIQTELMAKKFKRLDKICIVCKKTYSVIPSQIKSKFCSRLCSTFYKKGKKRILSKEQLEKYRRNRAIQKFSNYNTSIELKIKSFLESLNINFKQQLPIFSIKHIYACDFYLRDFNLIIECDGNYWHGNPKFFPIPNKYQIEQMKEDSLRNEELKNSGFSVLRIWEEDIKKMDILQFSSLLDKYRAGKIEIL